MKLLISPLETKYNRHCFKEVSNMKTMNYIKKALLLMGLSNMIASGASYIYCGDLIEEIREELS